MSKHEGFSYDTYPGVDHAVNEAYNQSGNKVSNTGEDNLDPLGGLTAALPPAPYDPIPASLHETSIPFQELVKGALNETKRLFANTTTRVPELVSEEFEETNWQLIHGAFERMNVAHWQPKIVIALDGKSQEFWTTIYNNLNKDFCKGINFDIPIPSRWPSIAGPNKWGISVMPTTLIPPILEVPYDSNADALRAKVTKDEAPVVDYLCNNGMQFPSTYNPSLGEYLTLQALLCNSKIQPLDLGVNTLLYPPFFNSSSKRLHLTGGINTFTESAYLSWVQENEQSTKVGIRPTIRGSI